MQWLNLFIKYATKLLSVYLAWSCNKNEFIAIRILVALVALRFARYYLIYYALSHWILRYPCASSFGSGFIN